MSTVHSSSSTLTSTAVAGSQAQNNNEIVEGFQVIQVSKRVIASLTNAGYTLSTVAEFSAEQLLAIKGIGRVALVELQQYFTVTEQEVEAPESSSDKRGRQELADKGEYVEALVNMFVGKHGVPEVIEMTVKGYKSVTNKPLAEYLLTKYMLASHEDRCSVLTSLLRVIYRERVQHGSDSSKPHKNVHIMMSSLISELGLSNEAIAKSFATGWKLRSSVNKLVGGGASKYISLAQYFITVIVDVLQVMNIIAVVKEQALQSNHTINKIIIKSKEARLHPTEDRNIIKLLLKDKTKSMLPYAQQYGNSTRLPDGTNLYGGHSLKYNQGLQPSHVMDVLNTIQRTAYTLVPEMIDADHPIGKKVRAIAFDYFNATSYNEFIEFLDEYEPGTKLYTTVSLTPDNVRLIYNGFPVGLHVGRMSWILQLATEILLTDTEAHKLEKRILDIKGSGKKLKGKEIMEILHYESALCAHAESRTTGVVTSNDFKGSGPLMQAIMTKDLTGLLASITYDGIEPSDPYTLVLWEIPGIKNHISELIEEGMTEIQAIAEIRNWVKGHVQPIMYGSGSKTSLAKALENGSRISQADFMVGFAAGLPWTNKMLSIIKSWAKRLSKYASNDLTNVDYARLDYRSSFGANCTITPLSKDYENKVNILGHKMMIPCKIVDMDEHRVKTVAAGSHQLDSSVLMFIHSMFGGDMYSIHDDFRCSIREEDRLQQCAIDALQYFWERDDLMDNYIGQVFYPLNAVGSGYKAGSIKPEIPELDWSKVTRVLY